MSIYPNLISTCGHRIGVATAIVLTILTVKGAVVIARPENLNLGFGSLFCAIYVVFAKARENNQ